MKLWPQDQPGDGEFAKTWKSIFRGGYVALPAFAIILIGRAAGWWG